MESMDYYKFQRHASKTAFDLLSVLMNKKKTSRINLQLMIVPQCKIIQLDGTNMSRPADNTVSTTWVKCVRKKFHSCFFPDFKQVLKKIVKRCIMLYMFKSEILKHALCSEIMYILNQIELLTAYHYHYHFCP